MNRQAENAGSTETGSLVLRSGLALFVLLAWFLASANGQSQTENQPAGSEIPATHLLGMEAVERNADGQIAVEGGFLRFDADEGKSAKVRLSSVQNIALDVQDRQVGGVPMTLGKAAVPFGGGRAVSLLSHKKYDSVDIQYVDANGGFHSAIFRVGKGQGQKVKDALIAQGVQLGQTQDTGSKQNRSLEAVNTVQQFSLQVDRVDPGGTTLEPAFSDAIYENIIRELAGAKRFKEVFRSGDRSADSAANLLVVKTLVERYDPGSETRRAVTTISGATKLKVRVQVLTPDGRTVLDRVVDGNVRFIGDNLHVTDKVAKNAAKLLKEAKLSEAGTARAAN